MRNTILIVFFLSIMVLSCSKDNYGSSPGLQFKSVNATVLQQNQQVIFTLSFTDTNGDLDSLFIHGVSKSCIAFNDSTLLPSFTTFKKQSGDIIVTYNCGVGNGIDPYIRDTCGSNINDTCYFRFVVKDLSGKTSDTVQSPTIIFIK